jgi:hypothetical protein
LGGRSKASFAIVQWVIGAYVLILISERETAPMRGGSRKDVV